MYKRTAYYKVEEIMNDYKIPILVGLRRTGKTTILNQLKQEYKNSVILRFDSIEMRPMKTIDIFNEIKLMMNDGIELFLFDEIQVRDDWDVLLKDLYDSFLVNKQIKVVVTGSSSISFEKRDTGVDRTEKVLISTLDFHEYLEMKVPKETPAKELFEHFLGNGAFPEYVNKNIGWDVQKQKTLEPIINDDIPSQYNISTGNIIRLLFELSSLSNGEFNKSKSSARTGISINQINNYLDILEKAQIIKIVYKVGVDGSMSRYSSFKVYINPHFHLWLLNKTFEQVDPIFKGHIVESYWLFATTQINGYYKRFYYFKDRNSNEEIDFVTLSGDPDYIFDEVHEFKYSDKVVNMNNAFKNANAKSKNVWYCGEEFAEKGISYKNIFMNNRIKKLINN